MIRRRSLFSLTALLLPGAFDRIAAAAIASEPEAPQLPDVRSCIFSVGGTWYELTLGPNGEKSDRIVPRAEMFGHVPDPEPIEVSSGGRIGSVYWADDPRDSCTRCASYCNADECARPGVWMCLIGLSKADYLGGIEGMPATQRV